MMMRLKQVQSYIVKLRHDFALFFFFCIHNIVNINSDYTQLYKLLVLREASHIDFAHKKRQFYIWGWGGGSGGCDVTL